MRDGKGRQGSPNKVRERKQSESALINSSAVTTLAPNLAQLFVLIRPMNR